jgi:hypothetical protein
MTQQSDTQPNTAFKVHTVYQLKSVRGMSLLTIPYQQDQDEHEANTHAQ